MFPIFLQKGVEEILPHLLKITRGSLELGKFEANEEGSICLTLFLFKTMEMIVNNCNRTENREEIPYHSSHHTYRMGRSIDTALDQLTEVIQSTTTQKEMAMCAFIHISGVFDNTTHVSVRYVLERRGVTVSIFKWMYEVFTMRKAERLVSNQSVSVKASFETPQKGVIISPPTIYCNPRSTCNPKILR